jgi:hypothetical protein
MVPVATFNPKAAIPEPVRRNRGGSFSFENCISQDGSDDIVQTTGISGLPVGDFSLSLWCKNAAVPGNSSVFGINPNAGANVIAVFLRNASIFAGVFNNVGESFGGAEPVINPAIWNHVVITGKQSQQKISVYINSVRQFEYVFTSGWLTNYGLLSFTFSIGGAFRNNGLVDETIFWERVITQSEIDRYYNQGIGSDSYDLTNVLFWYKFNETGSPATAADSSGNGYDLTLTNGPTFVPH